MSSMLESPRKRRQSLDKMKEDGAFPRYAKIMSVLVILFFASLLWGFLFL